MKNKEYLSHEPYLIAEIGVNYYDIAKLKNISPFKAAKLMIDKAKEGSADAVKFQSYKADSLASTKSPAYWDLHKEPITSQYELFRKYDKFDASDYEQLAKYCNEIAIDFLSTPFDFESVDYLDPLMKYYKISSSDITNHPLIQRIAEKMKPIFLSTGASTIKEIQEAIEVIQNVDESIDIVFLHCVLSYPTLNENANLNRIKILKKKFKQYTIGYSDHTVPDPHMIILTTAYLLGAQVIEKHFTLDKSLPGNDHYHAMNVEDLILFRRNINIIKEILSKNEKDYLPIEEISRKNARRSIVAKNDLSEGTIISQENIAFKRPGEGISPKDYRKLIGKILRNKISADSIITWNDVK